MFRINEVSKDLRELDAMLERIKAKELEARKRKEIEAVCRARGHQWCYDEGSAECGWCGMFVDHSVPYANPVVYRDGKKV